MRAVREFQAARDRRSAQGLLVLPLLLALLIPVLIHSSACGGSWNGGIIARLAWSEVGGLRVVDVPRDGAAWAGGLRPGDRIILIDGEAVEGRSEREVVQDLRGEVGSEVVLEVMRDGETEFIRVERAPYRSETRR
ncbi:MAG: PDZ domain-containing protein [Deltaproteobacteria bacterium]|nr:PDZ domain-containing protein [Deltaproteobacteria bacterium]